MRSFADTLPTLRESAAPRPVPPVVRETGRFEPVFMTRTAKPKTELPAPSASTGDDQPNVADIRRELLRRQNIADPAETGAPTGGDAPTGSGAGSGDGSGAAPHAVVAAAPAAAASPATPSRPAVPRSAASVVPPFVSATQGNGRDAGATVAEQIAEAVAAARKQAEAEKAAAVEFARKVERDVAARAVTEARAAWCAEEGQAFRDSCTAAFDALHRTLSDAFARALAPIAEAAIRDAAVRRFAAVLDDMVGPAADRAAVTVRGPAQLVEALRQASGDIGVAFEEAEGATELCVTVDETTLRTTVGAWADTLARTLGTTTPGEDDD